MPRKNNIYLVLSALGITTVVRNALELLGPLTGSTNFCCFAPNLASFLNTFTYTLLLVFGGMYLVHRILGGTREQLHSTVLAAVLFLHPLFILVPLVNLGLNYHGPRLPLWVLPWMYLPAGSVVGFAVILGALPPVLRRIYPQASRRRIFVALSAGFLAVFAYTYCFALWFSMFGFDPALRATCARTLPAVFSIQVYSLLFLLPLLPVFPLFLRSYFAERNRVHGYVAYLLMLSLTGYLTWSVVTAFRPV